ncbi:hypothetical protein Pst134EA_005569 [Puccinia striiformis f. sp. tritici]|uniref:hypothetical protein n=1 Tax=Puccinia striiformis f. sp. tritici TaxID=168172 RepID=UPI002008C8E2|nr:hypothetical protein Pst134EA_005569 [Puccinia striiformis f. sp. tritici]KAH9471690.1 hypothetical protein Pst134EA_005569 [Puccinia striiformis f. sp. tritici]
MFSLPTSISLTLLALQATTATPSSFRNATGPQPFQDKPCYMTGQFKVPDGVHINPHVTCLEGYQSFHNIPDVLFDRTQYVSGLLPINMSFLPCFLPDQTEYKFVFYFQKKMLSSESSLQWFTDLVDQRLSREPKFSPVGFAVEFFTPKKRNAKITRVLLNLMTVYDATNAALRSYGNERMDDVKKIKGPAAYLAFQYAISTGDLQDAAKQLKRVVDNCVNCKSGEREAVKKIARQHDVKLPESDDSNGGSAIP